jgi:nitrogen fixation/metabolism regulation signal transduction histidine kinase
MGLILYQLAILRKKLRERVFGSKLTLRLMVVFALMALIPGGLMYAVSYQFIQRSIESWFDVRVDDRSNVGLRLARTRCRTRSRTWATGPSRWRTRCAVSQAVDVATLNRLREQHSVEEGDAAQLAGRVIAQAGPSPSPLFGPADPNVLRSAHAARCESSRGHSGAGLYLRVLVPGERAHDRR